MKKYFLFTSSIISILWFFVGLIKSLYTWMYKVYYLAYNTHTDNYMVANDTYFNFFTVFRFLITIPILILGIIALINTLRNNFNLVTILLIICNVGMLFEVIYFDWNNFYIWPETWYEKLSFAFGIITVLGITSLTILSFIPFKEPNYKKSLESKIEKLQKELNNIKE